MVGTRPPFRVHIPLHSAREQGPLTPRLGPRPYQESPPHKSALSKAWRSVLDPETTPLTTDTGRWSRLGSRKAPKVSLHRPHSI